MILIRHLFFRGNIPFHILLSRLKMDVWFSQCILSMGDLFSLSSWNSAVNHKKFHLHDLPDIIQNIHRGYSNLMEIKSLNWSIHWMCKNSILHIYMYMLSKTINSLKIPEPMNVKKFQKTNEYIYTVQWLQNFIHSDTRHLVLHLEL